MQTEDVDFPENVDFPEEIVLPIKALSDDTRRRIILALTAKSEFSYSEILDQFELKKGTLTHHIHHLISSGLIRNFTKNIPTTRHTSYYELTDFGCRFINGLKYTLSPMPIKKTIQYNSVVISEEYPFDGSATPTTDQTNLDLTNELRMETPCQ